MQKPRVLSVPQPLSKNRAHTAPLSKITARLSSTAPAALGATRWQGSLLASMKEGWRPGSAGWRWVRSLPEGKRRFWALLDASRSSGAGQFLTLAREALAGLMRAPMRVSLLLIHEGKLRWLLRNGAPKTAVQKLEELGSAAGKSPLQAGLQALQRAVKAGVPTVRDTVCICSDGMPSLRAGQTAAAVAAEVRSAVGRLAKTLPSPVLWLSPKAGRAHSGWLEGLVWGSGTVCVSLESSHEAGAVGR